MPEKLQREPGHQPAHHQQHHAHVGIVDGDGAQAAQRCVGQARQREQHRDREDRQVRLEQRLHEARAGVQHHRQQDEHVAQQEQHRHRAPQRGAVRQPLLEQLGARGAVVLVVHRHQHLGQHQQARGGAELPPHLQHVLRAVHAHDLLGADVGQQQAAGDERPAQVLAGQEEILRGIRAVGFLAVAPPGGQRHQQGQAQEHRQLHEIGLHRVVAPSRRRCAKKSPCLCGTGRGVVTSSDRGDQNL